MGAALRLDVDAPFDLWLVDLSTEPKRNDIARLSRAEQCRAQRFHFNRDRQRYLVAHAELQRLLMERVPPAMQNNSYATNAFGKPELAGAYGPCFNLSYAGDMALIGLSARGPIGVDMEMFRPIDDDDITSEIFDASEIAAILATRPGAARSTAFLRAWTRKEACLKAVGTGLSTPPANINVGVSQDIRHVAVVSSKQPVSVEVGSFWAGDRIAAWARLL